MIGTTIAHYRVTAKLGEGGMGAVYRATDTKLNREVAIKVLPHSVGNNPERRARFEREAQVLAALNHPNIAAIYGVEEGALILELVEGPTLAERIAQGPIPPSEAASIARQIAEALAAAHDKGIIHRDLKPANVKITPDGQVKVLDFGLAKAMDEAPPPTGNPSTSPTITIGASVAGMILGTAAYMSPEQARGNPLDKRSDIWSFGVVLWEMLTGKMLFSGESISDTLAAVLKTDPDWRLLPARTPAHLRRMLERCLQRDGAKRLRDIGLFLEEPLAAPPAASRARLPWALAGALAFALIFVLLRPSPKVATSIASRHFLVNAGDLAKSSYGRSAVISPDGRQIAYAASGKLWIRDLNRVEAAAVEASDGAEMPFWSADSSLVGFIANRELKKVPRSGGKPSVLCNVGTLRGAAFRPDLTGVIFADNVQGLGFVDIAGGEPRILMSRKAIGAALYAPMFVPGSNTHVIAGKGRIAVQKLILLNLENGSQEPLTDGAFPAYAPSGHIVYQPEPTRPGIWALPFSAEKRKATGRAFRLSDEGVHPSVSADGTLLFRDGESVNRHLVIRDREGRLIGNPSEPQASMAVPSISPDGTRVVLTAEEGNSADLWIHDPTQATRTRLTFGPDRVSSVLWLNNKEIAYSASKDSVATTFVRNADGMGEPAAITGPNYFPSHWSELHKLLLLIQANVATRNDVAVAARNPDGTFQKPEVLISSPGDDVSARFSPDGSLLVYVNDDTARAEVYVRGFRPAAGKWQISRNGGTHPRWSPDGRELFFVANGGELFSATISTTPQFKAGEPKALFRLHAPAGDLSTNYFDVFPDGKRFAIVEPVDDPKPAAIHILEHPEALP